MARTRGTAIKPVQPARPNKRPSAVLQDVTNTNTRIQSARGKGKAQVKIDGTKSPAPTADNSIPRQFAVAKKISKPARTTRKPLQAVSHNTRVTPAVKRDGKDAKRTSSRHVPAPVPSSPASSPVSDDVPTQPLRSHREPASVRSSRLIASTPAAVEQSMLVLKSFKRRSRQPSMLNMVKQRLESARSSIAPDAALLSSDDESLDLDNFLPDAAGTPLHASGHDALTITSSTKRKRSAEADSADTDHDKVHKLRKLVSQSDVDDEDPSLSFASAQEDLRISVTPEADMLLRSNATDYSLNITELAAGTSPVYESSDRGTPGSVIQQSQLSVSGPPISQRTPPKTRTTRQTAAPSSAALQSLLPKRRKRFATVQPAPRLSIDARQHCPSPGEDSTTGDVEEHSEFVRQSSRSKKSVAQKSKSSKLTRTKKAATKTYARRRAQEEDADNNLADESQISTMADIAKTGELAAAKKEFASIDKWELEYETLTTEDSSQGWR